MKTLKLNIVNGIVVAGLVAASMFMPLAAASLAHSQTVAQTSAAQNGDLLD